MASLGLDQASLALSLASWAWLKPPLAGLRLGGTYGWKRKFFVCECIGHQPLWGRCPSFSSHATMNAGAMGTADHATLLWLFMVSVAWE